MEKSFLILTLSIIALLSSCSFQKCRTLESKNKKLQHQIDSLKQVADSAINESIKNAFEAMKQRELYDECQKKVRIQTNSVKK